VDEFYSRTTIDRLVEGQIQKGLETWHWYEVEGAWAELRSYVEQSGDVDSEAFVEVLDLENAIASLRGEHPEAALVVIARMFNFERDDLRVFRNFDRLSEKAKAYLSAYLSGRDPEDAYRRAARRTRVA
jgi:hypothetical protein